MQITFAPLDWAFAEHAKTTTNYAVMFGLVGLLLVVVSIIAEWVLSHE